MDNKPATYGGLRAAIIGAGAANAMVIAGVFTVAAIGGFTEPSFDAPGDGPRVDGKGALAPLKMLLHLSLVTFGILPLVVSLTGAVIALAARRRTASESHAREPWADNFSMYFLDQILIGASVNVALIALTQPVMAENQGWSPLGVNMLGAYQTPAWYANFPYVAALCFSLTTYRSAALVLCLSAIVLAGWFPRSIGGWNNLGPGYYFWISGMLLLAVVNAHPRPRVSGKTTGIAGGEESVS